MIEKNRQKEIDTFLALVRAGLWENKLQLTPMGTIDFYVVYQLAQEQSVMGLVTSGLDQVSDIKPPKEVTLLFVGEALQIEQHNKDMNRFVAGLIENLRHLNIYTLLLKGQGIAQCYERPLWRACGDVDLFLSDDNYIKAKEYLLPQASYSDQETKYGKHLALTMGQWTVELHGRLCISLSTRVNKVLDTIKKETFYEGRVRSWMNGNVQTFLLSPENDALYVFAHLLNHFYKGGIGLRQICDWCRLLWTYRDSISRPVIEEKLKKMGLMEEWKAFGAFAVEYLGMPEDVMPFYSPESRWKRKAARICSFIIEVGNMGHNRDMSYLKKPYLERKWLSFKRRIDDMFRHASIFPKDTLRFLPNMLFRGVQSAIYGE